MKFLTSREVAKELDVCPDYIRLLARAGKLKAALVIGRGMRLFDAATVEQLRTQRATSAKKKLVA
jgi:excisionase family DNA binding protein